MPHTYTRLRPECCGHAGRPVARTSPLYGTEYDSRVTPGSAGSRSPGPQSPQPAIGCLFVHQCGLIGDGLLSDQRPILLVLLLGPGVDAPARVRVGVDVLRAAVTLAAKDLSWRQRPKMGQLLWCVGDRPLKSGRREHVLGRSRLGSLQRRASSHAEGDGDDGGGRDPGTAFVKRERSHGLPPAPTGKITNAVSTISDCGRLQTGEGA